VKHAKTTVRQRSIHDVQIIAREVSPEQFIHGFGPSQAAISQVPPSQQFIEIFFRIPMSECRLRENHPRHTGTLAAIFVW
jgi:hypothetical protein